MTFNYEDYEVFMEKSTGIVFTLQEVKDLYFKKFGGNRNVVSFEEFIDGFEPVVCVVY